MHLGSAIVLFFHFFRLFADNGAETNCRIAHNLAILLMNSNCFAIFFSGIIAMSVQISIKRIRS